jgi:release factor glutamine methyltransferase
MAPTALTLLKEGQRRLSEQGIEGASQEAERLLLWGLSLRRIDLYIEPDQPVSLDAQTAFLDGITRRARHEPLQYIMGEADFCGLSFRVRPGVFIPRPETELIVQAVTESVEKGRPSPTRILDLCTGSGALAITLAKQFPKGSVTAVDLSSMALKTARENCARHNVSSIHFLEGDLFGPVPSGMQFDLIVCNPPYIADDRRAEMDPEVLHYEPQEALFSPNEGMAHLKQVLTQAPTFLAKEGTLLMEMGLGQSQALRAFVEKGSLTAQVIPDWAGIDRILVVQWTR